MEKISCRKGCGACCIAPSISSPIPGMRGGKPAGTRCIHLTIEFICDLYGKPARPEVCVSFQAFRELCGRSRHEAMEYLARLEAWTIGPMGP